MYKLIEPRVSKQYRSGAMWPYRLISWKQPRNCLARRLKREKSESNVWTNHDIIFSSVGHPRGCTRRFPRWREDTDGGAEEERSQHHWSWQMWGRIRVMSQGRPDWVRLTRLSHHHTDWVMKAGGFAAAQTFKATLSPSTLGLMYWSLYFFFFLPKSTFHSDLVQLFRVFSKSLSVKRGSSCRMGPLRLLVRFDLKKKKKKHCRLIKKWQREVCVLVFQLFLIVDISISSPRNLIASPKEHLSFTLPKKKKHPQI